MHKKKFLLLILAVLLASAAILHSKGINSVVEIQRARPLRSVFQAIEDEPARDLDLPTQKIIPFGTHVFQTFNNCGPASLSIALSLYGINVSQTELGNEMRPYQNQAGDNDDKSVTLAEIAEKSKDFGFTPYHRPNGTIDVMRAFIANDMPVITQTWLRPDDDIGHFRVVRGYDDNAQELIQDDSYDGKNLWFSYDEFNVIWKKYNYEFLVMVPKDKIALAEDILGENADEKNAWKNAAELSRKQLEEDSGDVYARFNLVIALYNIGDYESTVAEFEKVEDKISFRTLWYQIEPIQAYYELGDYDRVFEITDRILTTGNRAFSELYYIRGQIYLKQGDEDAAREEFEKAVLYNKNYEPAKKALENL